MTREAVIAANRFGLGARPGELARIASAPRQWLERQIDGARAVPEAIRALPGSARVFTTYSDFRRARRASREDEARAAQRALASIRQTLAPLYLEQAAARCRAAVASEESFRERLVHFWANHFAVSAEKPQVLALAGTLENEAIRPNVGQRFLNMLLAVESHPAMILYLDNQASIGPASQLGRRAARSGRTLGINENLAREILELHTLGVDGGYTQEDVTSFARALTGWSIGTADGRLAAGTPGEFFFREAIHEPGPKVVLGKRYEQSGSAQPRAILEDLARNPATARHIAIKLARHFIADEPPAAAVERIARAYIESDGDLPTVHRALIESPEAWDAAGTKLKTPQELVLSTFRLLDFSPQAPRQAVAPFELLGQRPYAPGSPAGWPDTANHWDGPDAVLKRIEWTSAVAERVGARIDPLALGAEALGVMLAERTHTAIARASSAAQGIALLLASPEFQRR